MNVKRLVIGAVAHVDAGKTSLMEALLYESGTIRAQGRVDHGDCYLDNNTIERERGITVFSKLAPISYGGSEFVLLDTPGHADLACEAERALSVMDYAILVISGTELVQAHTESLWAMLRHYCVPCFIFVSKMDSSCFSHTQIMDALRGKLSTYCVDFTSRPEADEETAMCDDEAMEEYLDTASLSDDRIGKLICKRQLFPVFFGSGLKNTGTAELLQALDTLCVEPVRNDSAAALVYKSARDTRDAKLTFMKITGGSLKVKAIVSYTDTAGEEHNEKIDEIRIYSGAKYKNTDTALPGQIYAVTGLSSAVPGTGIGRQENSPALLSEPVMSYAVTFPDGEQPAAMLPLFIKLAEEEPQLHVVRDTSGGEIRINLMGTVQKELISQLCRERFGINICIDDGRVMYRETIAAPVEGIGHYEPLRHYAEVHLILEPLPAGSGIVADSRVSEDVLDRNWQRLIMTHIMEKQHLGVLTGAPLTDVRITLAAGKAHLKHTEGGDFRQSTYRAIRQGLMKAQSVLLEPWYRFSISVPPDRVGRVMADIRAMEGEFDGPFSDGELSSIVGSAPAAGLNTYPTELAAFTGGRGRMSVSKDGYRPVRCQKEIVDSIAYDPKSDLENTPDSVFCSHGAGFNVPWDRVEEYMHLEKCM